MHNKIGEGDVDEWWAVQVSISLKNHFRDRRKTDRK